MTTITALVDRVYVPIFVGSLDQGRLLRIHETFQVPTDLWNMQAIARQMVIDGTISAA